MPVPTAGIYRLGAIVAIEAAPMGDDTRELLNVHHVAILREIDKLSKNISEDIAGMRGDLADARTRQDLHNSDDNRRFGLIDNRLAVLMWAYGVAAVAVAWAVSKMTWAP